VTDPVTRAVPLASILDDFFKAADKASILIQHRLDTVRAQDAQRMTDQAREEADRPPQP